MQSNLKSCNVISLNTYINEKLRKVKFSLCIVRFSEDLVRMNLSLGIRLRVQLLTCVFTVCIFWKNEQNVFACSLLFLLTGTSGSFSQ